MPQRVPSPLRCVADLGSAATAPRRLTAARPGVGPSRDPASDRSATGVGPSATIRPLRDRHQTAPRPASDRSATGAGAPRDPVSDRPCDRCRTARRPVPPRPSAGYGGDSGWFWIPNRDGFESGSRPGCIKLPMGSPRFPAGSAYSGPDSSGSARVGSVLPAQLGSAPAGNSPPGPGFTQSIARRSAAAAPRSSAPGDIAPSVTWIAFYPFGRNGDDL